MPVILGTSTGAGSIVVLNSSGQLPAVDGSLLTGIANKSAQVIVDFGFPTGPIENDTVTLTVAATWVTATTRFSCSVIGGTTDHDLEDAAIEGIQAHITTIVAGVSFDVMVYAPDGSWGQYKVNILAL